jgi:hypothetical protein
MTKAKAERIIERVGRSVREEMLARFRHNCCIATARAVTRTLDRFGVEARPLAVILAVFNRRFVEESERGHPPPKDFERLQEWCETTGGYSVGAAPGGVPASRGYNGHVVVYVPQVKTIFDGSIEQVNRAERGIVMPAALAVRLDGNDESEFFAGSPVMFRVRRCAVVYKLIDDDDWRRSADWQDAARTDDIVRNLIRAAKG